MNNMYISTRELVDRQVYLLVTKREIKLATYKLYLIINRPLKSPIMCKFISKLQNYEMKCLKIRIMSIY